MYADPRTRSRRTSIGSRPINPEVYERMSTPQKMAVGRRYRKAVRVVPRMLAMFVLLYALALSAYFGKYRVRPRHHHAPDLPAVLREGEIETSSARRLLCSAAPLRWEGSVGVDGLESGLGSHGGGVHDGRVNDEERTGSGDEDHDGAGRSNGNVHSSLTSHAQKRTPVTRGQFVGPSKPFNVPNDREPYLNATDARVFLLTGISASTPGAEDLLDHFLNHYVHALKVPKEYLLTVVHTRGEMDSTATRKIQKRLEDNAIFYETWEGEALLFSAVAHHWEHSLAAFADDADWVVVVDLDEHVEVPAGESLPSFLGSVDSMGYSLLHGTWIDRVAESGEMASVPRAMETKTLFGKVQPTRRDDDLMDATFPLRCVIGSCLDPHHVGFASGWEQGADQISHNRNHLALHGLHHYSTLVGVVGGGRRVFAHKARYAILDVRTLQDFGLDDVVTSASVMEDHESSYPVPLKVMHYQWSQGVQKKLDERRRKYAACNLRDQEKTTGLLISRLVNNRLMMNTEVCPDLACYRQKPSVGGVGGGVGGGVETSEGEKNSVSSDALSEGKTSTSSLTDSDEPHVPSVIPPIPIVNDNDMIGNGGALGGYGAERRVIIFASVWEHVDGVSRTMKRLASHLRDRTDSRVFVMSPDLVERDFRIAATHERYHVTDVPHIPMPGRGEYKMAAPLQQRQRHQMETFGPHVVHVAAPDMLGHSAVRWAAENGVCSVCSYHTAYDTYLQYYRVGVLATPLRQMLSGFYSSCDVVATPSYAAAEHLSEMGVPRERMGFFPRGINHTLYSPKRRSHAFRRDVFGVGGVAGDNALQSLGRKSGSGLNDNIADQHSTKISSGTKDGEVVILWVARIVREKGLGSFVKTVQELLRLQKNGQLNDLPKFKVVVAGDGPDLPWMKSQLKGYENVKILGHAGGDRLADTYSNGDIFFFPSRTEVFPNNLIEAMASGLPVITDDVGVNRAIVKDGVTGILVKDVEAMPGDVSNWVEAVVDLLRKPEKRDALGMAARKSTHGLTWERTFASLRRSYDRCRPGRPYARHLDKNVPWSKAAAEDKADGSGEMSEKMSEKMSTHSTPSTHSAMSLSGALLGISAQAAGGGGAASALAAATALFTNHHHTAASHHAEAATTAAATLRDEHLALDDPEHPDHDPEKASFKGIGSVSEGLSTLSTGGTTGFGEEAGSILKRYDSDSDLSQRMPGAGPGFVNQGGASVRDVIVDDGAPPGSLLYRVSYGMTGGYVRSLESARADDLAIDAAELAAAESAKAFAATVGRWGGGGALGGGPGFEVGGFYDTVPNEEKY